jgi:hypothetical protein
MGQMTGKKIPAAIVGYPIFPNTYIAFFNADRFA